MPRGKGARAAILVIELEALHGGNRCLCDAEPESDVPCSGRTGEKARCGPSCRRQAHRVAVCGAVRAGDDTDEVLAIAKKMQRTIAQPVTPDCHELFLSSRIGISLSGQDGIDAPALIEAAVHALERALGTRRHPGRDCRCAGHVGR